MAAYYKLDSRKVTLGEYWNITRSWKALIPWIAARLGAPLNFGTEFRQPESVRELEVPEAEFLPQAKAKLQPLLDQCLQLGFHSPRYYHFESLRQDVHTSFISLLHQSGQYSLRLMHSLGTKVTPPKETVLVVLLSELKDGTYFFTSDQREKFKCPPGILNNRVLGGSPLQLIESHRQKLAELPIQNPPRPVWSAEELDAVWDRYEKLSVDFQISRGLYVPMNPDEVEGQKQVLEAARAPAAGGGEYADVLVEVNQLQNKKGGWGAAILILLVSVLLFVGVGWRQWSWKLVLMLVPILFIHEMGHYLAMKAFDYRNLRMFFIPFFGAAVSGRHYNVPGWKKVVVSLMGPVPGIVLGAIVGGAGLVLHQPWLVKVALVALILNGLNLLPVLPLDGGWIFHTLLFCRHPLLDAGFRVLAAAALMVGGSLSKDRILMYLGIPMLLSIPSSYRIARITRTLRERGVPPGSPDNQTIPPETAVAIIGELKKNLPKVHTTKMVAQQTLQVFETLNARPPGWLASIGLFFTYSASLGMAAVIALVLIIGQRGDFQEMLAAAAVQPRTSLEPGAFLVWSGADVANTAETAPIVIVAKLADRSTAERAFLELTNQLPATAALSTFGQSLLLNLPAADDDARKQWLAVLESKAKQVFVDSKDYPASLSLSCQAPSEEQAKAIETELNEYFTGEFTRSLIPPWLPDDPRTPEQRAAHTLARKTYLKARALQYGDFSDPQVEALQKKMAEARRRGDTAEAAALSRQASDLAQAASKQQLNKLKSGREGLADPVIVDLCGTLAESTTITNRAASRAVYQRIGLRMGQLPLVDDKVAPGEERFSAQTGMVFTRGRNVHLGWITFARLADAAPAVVDWLSNQGCTDFKYELGTGIGGSAETE